MPPTCRCSHPATAHEHYRDGDNCALCPCPDYRPPSRLRAWLAGPARDTAWIAVGALLATTLFVAVVIGRW